MVAPPSFSTAVVPPSGGTVAPVARATVAPLLPCCCRSSYWPLQLPYFLPFFVLFLFRRQKSSNKNGACKDKNPRGLHDRSSRLIASAKLSISSSPDVKGGCLQGGNLSRSLAAPKFKGVQVFTYREIKVATNRFSEANVIGNGGFGLMYRGVLSDGTLAAIKLLRREGVGKNSIKVQKTRTYLTAEAQKIIFSQPVQLNGQYQRYSKQ
ncbi:receptor-like serine/threonine-protein kinase NCRK [Arachis duranensis]|uniref:Receptor-like serine/threonine-protein kinase NCRK n=1 Tax=Arachis duranensis TaxID=130453 RepID=A0A9C6THQ0_ARADU|nr:receptor-like serine/threonine-protein kinase NCRK [Arachis duranensis]